MHVSRTWSFAEAEALDDAGLLVGEIHEAINRVLAVLEEPPVQMLSARPAPSRFAPRPPAPAKRTAPAKVRQANARGKQQPARANAVAKKTLEQA